MVTQISGFGGHGKLQWGPYVDGRKVERNGESDGSFDSRKGGNLGHAHQSWVHRSTYRARSVQFETVVSAQLVNITR